MLRYIGNEEVCRSVVMQNYFGDMSSEGCGVCDICLRRRKQQKSENKGLEQKILEQLQGQALSTRDLCRILKFDPQAIAQSVEKLKVEDKISADTGGKLTIIE